jgi:hypothetical protein
VRSILAAAGVFFLVACPGNSNSPTQPPGIPVITEPTQAPIPQTVTLVGTGDIADCPNFSGAEATAKLVDGVDGLVFTSGDNVYENGSADEFRNCYEPTWGRFKDRTRPTPGNHEYNTPGASGYFSYFGAVAGPSGRGYYSYDHGNWKVFSLNSNRQAALAQQRSWLEQELKANTAKCTLAYWHHPVYSSGFEGNTSTMHDVWRLLYEYKVDVVITGHSHDYERLAPLGPNGEIDRDRGIRQFVVGTGGKSFTNMGERVAASEAVNATQQGVLRMTLAPDSYSWEFLPVAGRTYRDAGSGACVQ